MDFKILTSEPKICIHIPPSDPAGREGRSLIITKVEAKELMSLLNKALLMLERD